MTLGDFSISYVKCQGNIIKYVQYQAKFMKNSNLSDFQRGFTHEVPETKYRVSILGRKPLYLTFREKYVLLRPITLLGDRNNKQKKTRKLPEGGADVVSRA